MKFSPSDDGSCWDGGHTESARILLIIALVALSFTLQTFQTLQSFPLTPPPSSVVAFGARVAIIAMADTEWFTLHIKAYTTFPNLASLDLGSTTKVTLRLASSSTKWLALISVDVLSSSVLSSFLLGALFQLNFHSAVFKLSSLQEKWTGMNLFGDYENFHYSNFNGFNGGQLMNIFIKI